MSAPTIQPAGAPQDRPISGVELALVLEANPYIPETDGNPCEDPQCTDETPCMDCATEAEQAKADAARERVMALLNAGREYRKARVAEQDHQLDNPAIEDAFAHLAIDHPNTCHTQADYPDWTPPGGAK